MQQVYLSSSSTDMSSPMGNIMATLKEKKVKLDSFEWMNLYQNVSSNMTLRVTQQTGPTTQDVTIAKGNYTADELADAIQSALNTAFGGSNYTVTYNTKTFKFDFVNSSNNFRLIYASSTIMPLLGFLADTSYALSVSSTNICDLSPLDAIYVECNLVNSGWKEGGKRSILAKIQVDKNPGEMIFYKSCSGDDWQNIYSESDTVSVTLFDSDRQQISSSGVNWNMCLLFK